MCPRCAHGAAFESTSHISFHGCPKCPLTWSQDADAVCCRRRWNDPRAIGRCSTFNIDLLIGRCSTFNVDLLFAKDELFKSERQIVVFTVLFMLIFTIGIIENAIAAGPYYYYIGSLMFSNLYIWCFGIICAVIGGCLGIIVLPFYLCGRAIAGEDDARGIAAIVAGFFFYVFILEFWGLLVFAGVYFPVGGLYSTALAASGVVGPTLVNETAKLNAPYSLHTYPLTLRPHPSI